MSTPGAGLTTGVRGQVRGSCPLHDPGEILAYLAWAVTIFYLVVGSAYRLSLLGVFSAPLVVVLQLGALGFGQPAKERYDAWCDGSGDR